MMAATALTVTSSLMADSLLARAQSAMDESRAIREHHQLLLAQHDGALKELRRAIRESAKTWAKIEARRENGE